MSQIETNTSTGGTSPPPFKIDLDAQLEDLKRSGDFELPQDMKLPEELTILDVWVDSEAPVDDESIRIWVVVDNATPLDALRWEKVRSIDQLIRLVLLHQHIQDWPSILYRRREEFSEEREELSRMQI